MAGFHVQRIEIGSDVVAENDVQDLCALEADSQLCDCRAVVQVNHHALATLQFFDGASTFHSVLSPCEAANDFRL